MALVAVVAASCGGDDDDDASPTDSRAVAATGAQTSAPADDGAGATSGWANGNFGPADSGTPVDGGQMSMGMFSEPSGLDPIVAGGGGYAGGTELGALYDVLVRYDYGTGEYVPQLAESLSGNADSTVWTITLRPNVNFTDGTPLDAAAVKASVERFSQEDSNSKELVAGIASIDTPDASTVVFNLKDPYAGFPFLLAGLPGMIVSPTAVEKLGAEFPKNPVGAGPFMFDHWNPGEEIVLKRNPDYWGDKAHLDSVRFVVLAPQTALDTLMQGGLQTAYFLDPTMSAQAKEKGLGGVTTIAGAGEGLLINAAEGAPGHDVKVRQAIGFAVDTQQVNERAYGDAGVPGNFVVAPGSIYSSGTPSKTADPEKAKALVEEAKQAGWDGTLRFTCRTSASLMTAALTVQAQLKAAGIDAKLNSVDGSSGILAVYKGDFDIACYGMSVDDALPYDAIARNLESTSAENRGKYANADMDAAIAKLKVAANNEQAMSIIADIQTVFDEDPPFVVFNNTPQVTTWNTNVHGIIATIKSQVLIGGAWLSE
jgi:peptide/nickel transport system substrate-binding protein